MIATPARASRVSAGSLQYPTRVWTSTEASSGRGGRDEVGPWHLDALHGDVAHEPQRGSHDHDHEVCEVKRRRRVEENTLRLL